MSATGESGPADRDAPPATAYECGICWTVYDPAIGDPYVQAPPGTPFALLPAHWHCPNCEAPKARFMALSG
jgi:rubredoxin